MQDAHAVKLDDGLELVLNRHTGKWVIYPPGQFLDFAFPPATKHEFYGIDTLVLNLSTDCNLRCGYCSIGNRKNIGLHMPDEIARTAIDTFGKYVRQKNIPNPNIIFFGGEPILELDKICKIVSYAESQGNNFIFSLQTNGTLLSPHNIERLKSCGIHYSLSLDGFDAQSNKYRFPERVLETIFKNVEKSPPGHILTVVTSQNVNELNDIALQAHYNGVKCVHFTLLTPMGEAAKKPELMPDNSQLLENMKQVFDTNIALLLDGQQFLVKNLYYILSTFFAESLPSSCTLCGGKKYLSLSVDYNGDLYPCDAWYGFTDFKLGNIQNTPLEEAMTNSRNFRYNRDITTCHNFDETNWTILHTNGCPANTYHVAAKINGKDPYSEYHEGIYEYVATRIPFLNNNGLIQRILEFE